MDTHRVHVLLDRRRSILCMFQLNNKAKKIELHAAVRSAKLVSSLFRVRVRVLEPRLRRRAHLGEPNIFLLVKGHLIVIQYHLYTVDTGPDHLIGKCNNMFHFRGFSR